MKPRIWKGESGWCASYQLNNWGLNDKITNKNFSSWNSVIECLCQYHKVIQWPTKPNAS